VRLGSIAEINKALAGYVKFRPEYLSDFDLGVLGKRGVPGRQILYRFLGREDETEVVLGVEAVESASDEREVGKKIKQPENELLREGWEWFKPSGVKRTSVAIQVIADGKPLPGAVVALWGGLPPFAGKVAEILTDSGGMARFENVALLPAMAFRVSKDGYAAQNVTARPDGAISLALEPEGFKFKWWMALIPVGVIGGIWGLSAILSKRSSSKLHGLPTEGAPALNDDDDEPGRANLRPWANRLRERAKAIERKIPDFDVFIPTDWRLMEARDQTAVRRQLRNAENLIKRTEKLLKEIEV